MDQLSIKNLKPRFNEEYLNTLDIESIYNISADLWGDLRSNSRRDLLEEVHQEILTEDEDTLKEQGIKLTLLETLYRLLNDYISEREEKESPEQSNTTE